MRCALSPRFLNYKIIRISVASSDNSHNSSARCRLERLQLLEEIIPLVIDDDERREIRDFDFADRFHAEFLEGDHLDLFDVRLGEDGGGATDAAQVKAT